MMPPASQSTPSASSPESSLPTAATPFVTPAPDPLRRPVPRPFLERLSRPLLVRFLADYASVLVGQHAFPLEALAASAQTDRKHVGALWTLLSAPPPELAPLRDDLLTVADAGTPMGHEFLLSQDKAGVLDHDLGAEDCAAIARLEHRPLFDSARPQTAGQAQVRAFASYESAKPRPLPSDPACAAAFLQKMSASLLGRGRTDHFKVHEWRSGTERHMELVYGRLATTRDLLGKTAGAAHEVTAQVTDRSTERAHAIFHDDTLRLDVAGPDWMKDLVRRTFGEAHFGSAAHFKVTETLGLSPLQDLASALSVEGISGLKKVVLQEVTIELGGPTGAWISLGGRGDCMTGPAASYAARALGDGLPCEAVFLLTIAGRARPLKLTLTTPTKIVFDRRDPRVVLLVSDWLVARGFMKVPEHLRGNIDAPARVEEESLSESS